MILHNLILTKNPNPTVNTNSKRTINIKEVLLQCPYYTLLNKNMYNNSHIEILAFM